MYWKIIGGLLIAFGAVVILSVTFRNSHKAQQPVVFSNSDLLQGLWNTYKANNLDTTNSRTFDRSRDDASTSEGESYTMLRATLVGDKDTFDKSWAWTQANLQHTQGDVLFSWYYGKVSDGTYKVDSTTGGNNTASDADEDIALSLVFAHDRWGDGSYLSNAQNIMNDIWKNEVVTINGKPYLLADNIEKQSNKGYYVVNTSYLAPEDYRIFAKYDTTHDWNALADNSYTVINAAMDSNLDKASSAGLPPDWIAINAKTAAITAIPNNTTLTTDYSYDAMRTPFRLALDYKWFGTAVAKTTLDKMSFLKDQWQKNQTLEVTYDHAGNVVTQQEAPAIYGGDLGYFEVSDPADAQEVYDQKLKILYTPDTNSWKTQLGYYDDNWAWFGLALHNGAFVNLDAQR